MESASVVSIELLQWLLLLLITTVVIFGWRCYRAGVLAAFGHQVPSGEALLRVGVAACAPALMCLGWLTLKPDLSSWAVLGVIHLATAWYGLAWLLPDNLTQSTNTHSRHLK